MKNMRENTNNILALALFIFVLVLGVMRLWESDTWWHIAAGRQISLTQDIRPGDAFSHTKTGAPWINDEWLGDVYLFGVHRKFGVPGLIVFAAALGACAMYLVFGICRLRGTSALVSVPLIAIGAVAARTRFTPRPEVISLLFISLFLYLLNKYISSETDDSRAKRYLWFIPIIQMLWVNTHPSGATGLFIILLTMIACVAAFLGNTFIRSDSISFEPNTDSARLRMLGPLLVVSAAVSLLNPYFLHALTAPFKFSAHREYLGYIFEWSPMTRAELLAFIDPAMRIDPQILCFELLAIFGAIMLLLRFRNIQLMDTILFIATLFMALTSRRFIALFAVAALPGIAMNAQAVLSPLYARLQGKAALPARAMILILLAVAVYHQIHFDHRIHFDLAIHRKFPVRAADFIEKNIITGHMYNEYGLGGYLIWRLNPKNKVFIDGRTTFYGPEFFIRQNRFEQNPTPVEWRALEKKYEINYAVLSSREPHQCNVLFAIQQSSPHWKIVFWDDRAMVLIKQGAGNDGIIKRYAYRETNPCLIDAILQNWTRIPASRQNTFIEEFEHSLKQTPDNVFALRALAQIAHYNGRNKEAVKLAERGLQADSRTAFFHAMLGNIALQENRKNDAIRHYRRAARLNRAYRSVLKKIRE